MNRDPRRNWAQETFPKKLMRWIREFFSRILFFLTLPFRALLAKRPPLKEKSRGVFGWIIFPFAWLLWFLLTMLVNTFELLVSWGSSRQTRAIIVALPALIAFGLFAFVLIYLYNTKNGSLVNTYFLRATKAENVESFETARMYYQKLLQLDKSNQSYEFLIARSFENEGNLEEARIRMAKLRNQADVAGVVNYWFARKTLEREDLNDLQKWQLCLVYLEEFLAEAENHKEANVLALEANTTLAEISASQNKFEDSIDYLLKAEKIARILAKVTDRSFLALARIQRRISLLYGQTEKPGPQRDYGDSSIQSAQRAIEFFEQQIEDNPNSIEFLLLLSDCHLFLRDYESAIRPIQVAMRIDLNQQMTPQLRVAHSRILSAWANELMGLGDRALSKVIEIVDEAIRLDPKNEMALAILAQISVRNIDTVSLSAKQKLEAAIGNAAAPFSVHMILGSYAAAQNDDDLAMKHLRQALLLNNRAPAVMNNLAFVLARLQNPRYEEALSLINKALQIKPGNPRFLDTRGNIYIRMKEYERAFHDLETAELQIKNNRALYENLLFLVQELGFEDIYRKKYQNRLSALKAAEIQPK